MTYLCCSHHQRSRAMDAFLNNSQLSHLIFNLNATSWTVTYLLFHYVKAAHAISMVVSFPMVQPQYMSAVCIKHWDKVIDFGFSLWINTVCAGLIQVTCTVLRTRVSWIHTTFVFNRPPSSTQPGHPFGIGEMFIGKSCRVNGHITWSRV